MLLALIPRVVWPDKPVVGGGGRVVQDFTGIEFAEGTSVSAGQVLEFYANFGTWGVVGGFLLFGWMIGRMDILVIRYLREGDHRRFLRWSMVSLALLQPGGNLLEIVVSVASAAIAAVGIGYFLRGRIVPKPSGVAVSAWSTFKRRPSYKIDISRICVLSQAMLTMTPTRLSSALVPTNSVNAKLRIGVASSGRFHLLDLARELDVLGSDVCFYSYVPRKRAKTFGLPGRCHVALLPFLFPLVSLNGSLCACSPTSLSD